MKSSVVAALVLGMSFAQAGAEQRFDKRLEAAAISIVATKMGDLRRGFDTGQAPVFVAPIDRSQPTHLSARSEPASAAPDPVQTPRKSSFVSY